MKANAWLALWHTITTLSAQDIQVVIGIIGTIATLAASYAAWSAARATRDSVQEMREARLQSVRPAIVLGIPSSTHVVLTTGKGVTVGSGIWDKEAAPVLIVRNLGTASALDIQIDWFSPSLEVLKEEQTARVEAFLAAANMELRSTGDLYVHDPTNPGRSNYALQGGYTRDRRHAILEPGEKFDFPFDDKLLFGMMLNRMAHFLTGARASMLVRYDILRVSYRAISGERFYRVFVLTNRMFALPYFSEVDDRVVSFSPQVMKPWFATEILATFSMFEMNVDPVPDDYLEHLLQPRMSIRKRLGIFRWARRTTELRH